MYRNTADLAIGLCPHAVTQTPSQIPSAPCIDRFVRCTAASAALMSCATELSRVLWLLHGRAHHASGVLHKNQRHRFTHCNPPPSSRNHTLRSVCAPDVHSSPVGSSAIDCLTPSRSANKMPPALAREFAFRGSGGARLPRFPRSARPWRRGGHVIIFDEVTRSRRNVPVCE